MKTKNLMLDEQTHSLLKELSTELGDKSLGNTVYRLITNFNKFKIADEVCDHDSVANK